VEKDGSDSSINCFICSSENRDKSTICVVETWHDLLAIEKVEEFRGVYHVLGGSLCPLEGMGPDDLRIDEFLHRVDDSVKEIIFATNPTPEGEATASFIASKLETPNVKISRLASGVPIGSSLEYMDRVTIYKALLGRQPF
jgi:recombination protein RecR